MSESIEKAVELLWRFITTRAPGGANNRKDSEQTSLILNFIFLAINGQLDSATKSSTTFLSSSWIGCEWSPKGLYKAGVLCWIRWIIGCTMFTIMVYSIVSFTLEWM